MTSEPSTPHGPAVISGAGSGIGRAVAVALGRRGYPLALLGRREGPLRETVEAALEGSRGEGLALPCDVRDWGAVEEAGRRVLDTYGTPDAVVPAAGVVAVGPADELAPEAFRECVETNLLGTFHLIRTFLPAMKEAGRGRLLPVLSVAATRGFPTWAAYCAGKWGVRGLVASLREELAGSGVLVTALYPGATATDLWNEIPGEWDRSRMVPVDEVARAVLYVLETEEPALVEELHVGPAGGAL
ncbi:MAG: SDR family oxidoreductase [Thermoanaerobaculia bacterium]